MVDLNESQKNLRRSVCLYKLGSMTSLIRPGAAMKPGFLIGIEVMKTAVYKAKAKHIYQFTNCHNLKSLGCSSYEFHKLNFP